MICQSVASLLDMISLPAILADATDRLSPSFTPRLLSVVEGISPGDLLYPDEPNVFPGPKSDIANFSSLGGLKDARCGGARLFPIDELLPGSSPHSRAKTP